MGRAADAAVFAGLAALDQGIKALTVGKTLELIPGVIRIAYTENHGFSLGMFGDAGTAALILSVIALAALAVIRARTPRGSPLRLPLLIMCAGALGNLLDRAFLGYVRDMFELLFVRFYVFNPADVFVTCGAALCALALLRPDRKETA